MPEATAPRATNLLFWAPKNGEELGQQWRLSSFGNTNVRVVFLATGEALKMRIATAHYSSAGHELGKKTTSWEVPKALMC